MKIKSGQVIAVALVAIVALGAYALFFSPDSNGITLNVNQDGGGNDNQDVDDPQGFAAGVCPTSGTTTLTLDIKNGEDSTADSTIDVTSYLSGNKGDFKTVTDTSGGTVSLNCGETYTMRSVSNNSVNAEVTSVENGPTGWTLNGDGSVSFTPKSANEYLKAVGSKHGVIEFRVFSVDNNAYRYVGAGGDGGDGNVNAFALTGKVWNGTTSENSTGTAVGAGQSMVDEIHFRSNQSDNDAADFGFWILVDASATKWNEPTVTFDGVTLSRGTLNDQESRSFGATYEYAYKVSGKITDSEHVLKTQFRALDGVNPADTDSPSIAIAAIGAYKATASNEVKISAVKDDSSITRVFTIQTLTLGAN